MFLIMPGSAFANSSISASERGNPGDILVGGTSVYSDTDTFELPKKGPGANVPVGERNFEQFEPKRPKEPSSPLQRLALWLAPVSIPRHVNVVYPHLPRGILMSQVEVATRPVSPTAPSPRAPSSQVPSSPAPSPPISGELARTTTLADLVPGFPLSDVNVEELADFLPDIIKNFVEERRMDRIVQN
ncbi:hypothetical protein N7527_003742 [Penicillium freii]|nr:hypothetical protein N7527_003742 [Penicillium freii]